MFWQKTSSNTRALDSFGLATSHTSNNSSVLEFHELELGIVLDIIIDDTHPLFLANNKSYAVIDVDRWPGDLNNKKALPTDIDLSWIGRALVRPIISGRGTKKDNLLWAYPLESNLSEYPLINECVSLIEYNGQLFYTRKINRRNWINNSLDFSLNSLITGENNTELYKNEPYSGRIESTTNYDSAITNYKGFAGKYFLANNKIRAIKRYEGDFVIESRHGQSIHMTAFDDIRKNDIGANPDYYNCGNPMILIRNRQRPLVKVGETKSLHKKLPPIVGTPQEKNVGGYLKEDINHDGSSIQITSGKTISTWVTTCYKKMFGCGEEVSTFNGKVNYKYPELSGDQIVIQSDRLVFSSRYGETYHYSKNRYSVVTDNEYIVDAHQQMVFTTNTKVVINSPEIYLGEYDMTNEPALLGQTTVNWLYELCNWLLEHTHWYHHSHVCAGAESPSQTQIPVQIQQLITLRDKLHTLMSRRVFLVGGGFAPGKNGGTITDGTTPTTINVSNGNGVSGKWNGSNYRTK